MAPAPARIRTVVNIHEAKTHFSKLVADALGGGEVIIAKANKPVLMLVRIPHDEDTENQPGVDKGKVWMAPDFDRLPEDVEHEFYK